ncbi:GNAT family N-acetyltransferase [soil metagenome]
MRKFTPDDLPELIEMRVVPEVNIYLGGTKSQNPDKIAERLQFYFDCYEKYGFAACAMIWKETGEFFGWSGLQPLEDSGEIEVGYGMKSEFWRKGVGFECAMAWLKYGFEAANLERIVAVVYPENTGSWRIMEKCGMKFEGMKFHYGMDLVFYAISKDEFFNQQK